MSKTENKVSLLCLPPNILLKCKERCTETVDCREEQSVSSKFYLGGRSIKCIFPRKQLKDNWKKDELFPYIGNYRWATNCYRTTIWSDHISYFLTIVLVFTCFSDISINSAPFTLKRAPIWMVYHLCRMTKHPNKADKICYWSQHIFKHMLTTLSKSHTIYPISIINCFGSPENYTLWGTLCQFWDS